MLGDLKSTITQLESEINDGTLAWGEVTKEGSKAFAQQVSRRSFSEVLEILRAPLTNILV